ncbi:cyclophilin-like protein [Lepidopterella palustris CBS 459.81]|uniref:Peptidyl-prolyl cis-trans isomerase n=1 Tax=Lepidopterella palustris CBS 459.81 TaxID=1314670 RepID=A0A8E2EK12_9PEZI|nr:cyclophilin-like protein [Lepidopterella palustris CBS 459.81]
MIKNNYGMWHEQVGFTQAADRVQIELFLNTAPTSEENFRHVYTSEYTNSRSQSEGYKGSTSHRVIPGFMIQDGDFIHHNGTGSACIHNASQSNDEDFALNKTHAPRDN